MNTLNEKLDKQLNYLYRMLGKYETLNKRADYRYNYRELSIRDQIEALEFVKAGIKIDWDECYMEDCQIER